MIKNFSNIILEWYGLNGRDLPWRRSKDPYKIWLSEIILQQTQIIQGTSYYLKFVENYPTVKDLAKAEEQDVLLLWQGLGYYSRARNLHKTAKDILSDYQGKFPENYNELIKLKGVGDYTASAIASICFNHVSPAIDGNVFRVISRLFNISESINKTSGKKLIKDIANTLISDQNPGDFNQALMDFGSQQCKPVNPDCIKCIFKTDCKAFLAGTVDQLPVKTRKTNRTKEFFYYFIIHLDNKEILIKKRTKGIWTNLYEFPKLFSNTKLTDKQVVMRFIEKYAIEEKVIINHSTSEYKHILSHKDLFIRFFRIEYKNSKGAEFLNTENVVKILIEDLTKYPFPVVIKNYIEAFLSDC